eukprot:4648-Hanusia_phi.AAC.3
MARRLAWNLAIEARYSVLSAISLRCWSPVEPSPSRSSALPVGDVPSSTPRRPAGHEQRSPFSSSPPGCTQPKSGRRASGRSLPAGHA